MCLLATWEQLNKVYVHYFLIDHKDQSQCAPGSVGGETHERRRRRGRKGWWRRWWGPCTCATTLCICISVIVFVFLYFMGVLGGLPALARPSSATWSMIISNISAGVQAKIHATFLTIWWPFSFDSELLLTHWSWWRDTFDNLLCFFFKLCLLHFFLTSIWFCSNYAL